MKNSGKYVLVGPAARFLGITRQWLATLGRRGVIRFKVVNGQKRYLVADLVRLKKEREQGASELLDEAELIQLAS
jgi:hypothetical protein